MQKRHLEYCLRFHGPKAQAAETGAVLSPEVHTATGASSSSVDRSSNRRIHRNRTGAFETCLALCRPVRQMKSATRTPQGRHRSLNSTTRLHGGIRVTSAEQPDAHRLIKLPKDAPANGANYRQHSPGFECAVGETPAAVPVSDSCIDRSPQKAPEAIGNSRHGISGIGAIP
jgi:hypothetical protein